MFSLLPAYEETDDGRMLSEVRTLKTASSLTNGIVLLRLFIIFNNISPKGVIRYIEHFQEKIRPSVIEIVIVMEYNENYITLDTLLQLYVKPSIPDKEEIFKLVISQVSFIHKPIKNV